MAENLWYLLASGFIFGWGSCFISCAPVLSAFTVMHGASHRKSLAIYSAFSLARVAGYIFLTTITQITIHHISNVLFHQYTPLLYAISGAFIITLGIITLLKPLACFKKPCAWFDQHSYTNAAALGFITGVTPCLPLLALIGYIIVISPGILAVVAYASVFSIGTILSPLCLLVIFSGSFGAFALQKKTLEKIVRWISGSVLCCMGGQVLIKAL